MPETDIAPGDQGLARQLRAAMRGEVRFDAFTRGLYATDASHYQIEPLGVVFPESAEDVESVLQVARAAGVPVLPRGGGTSQCGQTIGRAVVVDVSRHLTEVGPVVDGEIEVEPGVVLDQLNAGLASTHLWFPVDPATASRATLGGMAGNNSAGSRSLRYGMMVDNVAAVEAVLPDGRRLWLGEGGNEAQVMPDELAALRALYARDAEEIARRTPRTLRNVAGYNVDRLEPTKENLAHLLVGSEGTLAFFTRLRLRLKPLPRTRVLGVCHFDGLLPALDSVQHLVELGPSAVELVDQNVLELAAAHPDYRTAMRGFVRGTPKALLLVEFSDEAPGADLAGKLTQLEQLLGSLGFPDSVVRAETPAEQAAVWSVRKAGLNIVMSMAGPRKPISFIEDCAVPLEHLSEYARRIEEIFGKHGAEGTWYAHASVGCLHVRPALNLRDPGDVRRMRAIAEEAHEVVREYGGTHSGEHGDGRLRSEFLESMLGERMAKLFADVKKTLDPKGLMNPGNIVDPPRMDDRSLFRYGPGYGAARELPVVLDWSAEGGLLGAVEACNNNGACRKSDPGVMCPSFRATKDERHSTRGRANALRLAMTGQLGHDGLDSPEMAEAMSLCISCKGCKRECPAGVDMAALKLEWQYGQNQRHGIPLRERLLADLPRQAPRLSRMAAAVNAAGNSRALRALAERHLGISKHRALPRWAKRPWHDDEIGTWEPDEGPFADTLLFVDTFTRWFEPNVARAAHAVLARTRDSVGGCFPADGRPLCCGRTYLSAGMLDEARSEAERLVAYLHPYASLGVRIVGLEPSCVFTVKDEVPRLVPSPEARLVADSLSLFEEAVDADLEGGATLPLADTPRRAAVHCHCHQKAAGAAGATLRLLGRVPGLEVTAIESGCCGMAGAFGYHAEHFDISMQMGELELLPAVREQQDDTLIVAPGTSCRAQILDGTGRVALHPAEVLHGAM
ncbi:MAG: FAD-binding protein [Gemmatimonadetes bacterium]|jgi:FAD/FMN-containing dehydrogenase/Fe-S oxidoreductase|nr:FAD-binding protein [Gemmatimonadota bacterium]